MSVFSHFHTMISVRGQRDQFHCTQCQREFSLLDAIRHMIEMQPDMTGQKA